MFILKKTNIFNKQFIRHLSLFKNFRKIENKELLWLSKPEVRAKSFVLGNRNIENKYYLENSLDNNKFLKTMAITKFSDNCEGLPGFVHGGATCAVLDELTGVCCYANKFRSMTSNLNIEYLQPVKLNTYVLVESEIINVKGNKIFVSAKITDLEMEKESVKSKNIYKVLKR